MRRLKLIWMLYPAYVLVMLAALGAFTFTALHTVRRFYEERTRIGAADRLVLAEEPVRGFLAARDLAGLDRFCKEIGRRTATRLTVVAPDGSVLADSNENPAVMDNHLDRPEIRDALRRGNGEAHRWSHTLRQDSLYLAHPLRTADGTLLAVVRAAISVADFEQSLNEVKRRTLFLALLLILPLAGLTLLITQAITRPLREMQAGARRFAAGDFSSRLHLRHSMEMEDLADALNGMAGQLDDRFRTITRQRNEMEAILAGMTEGVIAVDCDLRILSLNQAAARIFRIDAAAADRQPLLEVVRNSALQDIITRALASPEPVEGETVLAQAEGERVVQMRAARLPGAAGETRGAVAVLLDVSRLRRLETMRREFVANVSHELRTPITTIQGFVETLQDGALADPDKARRFLDIIARQSSRLNAIIEDLLQLSRLETDPDRGGIVMEPCRLFDLLQNVQQGAAPAAAEKQLHITVECPPDLRLSASPNLLQQAVTNLVDNAVKYSGAGREILIRAAAAGPDGGAVIQVRDSGCGIAREYQSRIFERFYRVDKARSREQGGTGLGLAIVKHIMQAHGGTVRVDSEPGRGSTFTLTFPARPL